MKARFTAVLAALVTASLLAFAIPTGAFAQTSRGTVTGVVKDPQGAAIAGANVTLLNTQTNQSRTTTTNDEGVYRFDAIDLGNHTVTIGAAGFGELVKTNVIVNAGQTTNIDAQLAVGTQQITVDVTAEAGAILQTEAPVRGGNISQRQITELPIGSRNPVGLALTLPGVTTNRTGVGIDTFVINGARGRSNNFMIDGVENNDISVAGQGFQINNPDAVAEVSIQTANFDAEFGRAGGGVINVVTRGGGNKYHGTVTAFLDSSRDDAITSSQARNPAVLARGYPLFSLDSIYSGTLSGPLHLPRFGEGGPALIRGEDRTFFFLGYHFNRSRANASVNLVTPTAAGRETLRSIFPAGASGNVDFLLNNTAQTVGTNNPFFLALGVAPGAPGTSSTTCTAAGAAAAGNRPCVQFATFVRNYASIYDEHEFQTRVDHRLTDNDQLSFRFLRETQAQPFGGGVNFPGFDADYTAQFYNFLISETHVFSPTWTNEARLSYNRIKYLFPMQDPSGPAGRTPNRTVTSISLPQVASNIPQGRTANNYVVQDTLTNVRGNHTFRGGIDYLRQISTQLAPNNQRGALTYSASTGYTSFANFADDFGGSGGGASRDFGEPVYFPSMHRIAAFFQDRWKVTSDVTLTLGLRYENFGTPFNTLRSPAFTGLFNVDPVTRTGPFAQPNQVQSDNNNFAPSVGIAWAPTETDGLLGTVFGDKRTVIRAGYNIGYDSFFNNIASNAAASSPNVISTSTPSVVATGFARGTPNFSTRFPTSPVPASPLSSQTLILPNLVNPYYQRWSLGMQREMPFNLVMDLSYVGSSGTRLYINEDLNPNMVNPAQRRGTPANYPNCTPGQNVTAAQATAQFAAGTLCPLSGRFDNLQGPRTIRTNGGHSTYHAGQLEVRRRFADNFSLSGSYTWSKQLSNADEVFATGVGTASSVFALPSIFGGDRLEKSVSQNDRTHRAVFTYVYEIPLFREQRGFLGRALGGFQISGVTTFESGTPFTVFNGFDADGIGGNNDRPTYNPAGQAGVRAVPEIDTRQTLPNPNGSGTIPNPDFGALIRYFNPDANNATIDPMTARYIVNPAFIPGNQNFAGTPRFGNTPRNSERSNGINNWNMNLQKNTRITENTRLEARAEFFNVFNHPQFLDISTSNAGTGIASRFLNADTVGTSGGGRTIRYQLKFVF